MNSFQLNLKNHFTAEIAEHAEIKNMSFLFIFLCALCVLRGEQVLSH